MPVTPEERNQHIKTSMEKQVKEACTKIDEFLLSGQSLYNSVIVNCTLSAMLEIEKLYNLAGWHLSYKKDGEEGYYNIILSENSRKE